MFKNYSICSRCGAVIEKRQLSHGEEWESFGEYMCVNNNAHFPTNPEEYRSEKFGNDIRAEILWQFSFESVQDDDLGDVSDFGWFALFKEFNAILEMDSRGFVRVSVYESEELTMDMWEGLNVEYSEWMDADPNSYDDESDYYGSGYDF